MSGELNPNKMFVVEAKSNWDKAPMNSLLQFLTQSFAPILQDQLFPVLRSSWEL